MSPRSVLFVPQHQGGGTGEFYRLLALAEALHARDATVGIRFLMPQACPLISRVPFPVIESDLPDEARAAFHRRELQRLKPAIAVFDQTCRGATLAVCRRLGIVSICATSEPGTSGKTFRADWLWRLDEHWCQRFRLGEPALTPLQRTLAAISSTRRLVFDVCHAEAADIPPARDARPSILMIPGGGGYRIDGQPVAALFAAVALRIAENTDGRIAVVAGDVPATLSAQVEQTGPLPQAELIARMRQASLVIAGGGGGVLPQVLTLCTPCVAVPLGGSDQAERVRHVARRGWCLAAEPQLEAMTMAAVNLLRNEDQRRQIRERLAVLGLRNGLPLMVEALLARLDRAGR